MNDPRGADELRPRPQYGEYATPEEQRARIARPDTTQLLETGQDPDAALAVGASPSIVARPAARPVTPGRFADRVATIALLLYGLFNVISILPSMFDYASYAETVLGLIGVDAQLADPAAGRPWGVAAALVMGIGWLVTAVLSWRSLMRGRITWWIPLVAGIVFTLAAGVLQMVPMVSDPSVREAILAATG
jgi:hypothetical protein